MMHFNPRRTTDSDNHARLRVANPPLRAVVVALAALALLTGCQGEPVRDPDFAVVRPSPPTPMAATPGAIWQAGYAMPLFQDLRARNVGDILTIRLIEETQASKSADTTYDKSTETAIDNPTVLGQQVIFDLPQVLPLLNTKNSNLQSRLASSSSFDGEGESNISNSLTGEISVTVAEVLPNGNLVVQGEKLLTLNQGSEHIRVSGVVRAEDVGTDNMVDSTKVANARIVYAGQGPMDSSNAIGWLAKFFLSALMPF